MAAGTMASAALGASTAAVEHHASDLAARSFPRTMPRLFPPAVSEMIARACIAALFTMLSVNLVADYMRTGHVTGLLLIVGESLVVILTVVRRRAIAIDRSAVAAVLTTVSLVGPVLLRATAGETALASDQLTALMSGLGLVLVVLAKMTLGRSFGVVPANRGVVVRGPYTLVRHPIYAGYLITHVAFLMAHPTARNLAIVLIGDVALVFRALMEERVLSSDEAYQQYCRRVAWHLVPGVF